MAAPGTEGSLCFLNDFLMEGRAEGKTEGKMETLLMLIQLSKLSVDDAAELAGMSLREFERYIDKLHTRN